MDRQRGVLSQSMMGWVMVIKEVEGVVINAHHMGQGSGTDPLRILFFGPVPLIWEGSIWLASTNDRTAGDRGIL